MRKTLAMVLLGFLAACSSGETQRGPEPTASAPEFVNGGECVPDTEGLHPRAGCVTSAHGGGASLFIYAIVGNDDRPKRWRLRYEADDVEIDQPLEAGNPFSYPRAIGAIDVEGDGAQEWLIKTVDLASHGTNWQRLHLFVHDDDRFVPVRYEGEPLSVNVGGPSRLGEGARCDDGHFVLLRTEAQNRINTVWSFSERFFERKGAHVEFITRREGRLRLTGYNDPDLDPYYQLECGDFLYP